MPINRTNDFSAQFFDYLDSKQSQWRTQPVYLGGASGSNGGQGTTVGGFVGKLAQRYVAYDTTESSTYSTGSSPSILDNLNHIRAMISGSGGGGLPYSSTPANVAMYGLAGSSTLYARGDHQHFHGQLLSGDLHSVFTTGSRGFVPAPGSTSGLFLRDDGTWAAPASGSGGAVNTYPYNLIPQAVTVFGAAGSSGSFSRGDHQHFHGQLVGGDLHSAFTTGSNGFVPAPGSVLGKVLSDNGTWVVQTGGSGGGNAYPYTSLPASVGTATAGTSGSFSRGDHAHAHGAQSADGTMHALATQAQAGFLRQTASTSGSFLNSAGNWSLPAGGTTTPLSGATPQPLGTAAPGSSGSASKDDHTHAHGNLATGSAYHANATISNPGFLPTLDNNATHYLNGSGNWVPVTATSTNYGQHIVRVSKNGASGIVEYTADSSGFSSALGDAVNGDRIYIPAVNITVSSTPWYVAANIILIGVGTWGDTWQVYSKISGNAQVNSGCTLTVVNLWLDGQIYVASGNCQFFNARLDTTTGDSGDTEFLHIGDGSIEAWDTTFAINAPSSGGIVSAIHYDNVENSDFYRCKFVTTGSGSQNYAIRISNDNSNVSVRMNQCIRQHSGDGTFDTNTFAPMEVSNYPYRIRVDDEDYPSMKVKGPNISDNRTVGLSFTELTFDALLNTLDDGEYHILLPPGNLALTSNPTWQGWPKNQPIRIVGSGKDVTFINASTFTLSITTSAQVIFENMTVSFSGISLQNQANLTFDNCNVNLRDRVYLTDSSNNPTITFRNCVVNVNNSGVSEGSFSIERGYCYLYQSTVIGNASVLMYLASGSSYSGWLYAYDAIFTVTNCTYLITPDSYHTAYLFNCHGTSGVPVTNSVSQVHVVGFDNGVTYGTSDAGERSTWSMTTPAYHASDISTGSPVYHLPVTSSDGYVPAWSASNNKWVATAPSGGGVSLSNNTPANVGTAAAGSGSGASRSDHIHGHGNQSGGALHSVFGTSSNGFVPGPSSTLGNFLNDGGSWVGLAYNGVPITIGGANLAGSSGSFSRGDHQHYHGKLSGGDLHSVFSSGSHGFVPAPGTATTGSVLSAGGWSLFAFAGAVPATLTVLSAAATGSSGSFARSDHTHAITSGSNVSAGTQSLLASDTGGGLTLHHLNVGVTSAASAVGTMAAAATVSSYGSPLSSVKNSTTINSSGSSVNMIVSLPVTGTWKQADLYGSMRSDYKSVTDVLNMRFNGVSTGYMQQTTRSAAGAVSSYENINGSSLQFEVNGVNALANAFSPIHITLYDYAPQSGSANHFIAFTAHWGTQRAASSGSIYDFESSGMMNSAGLVSSVMFYMSGGDIAQYASIESVLILA